MGTNFYTLKKRHIGRRSAAGLYCWDCRVTLRKGGESLVHHSDAQSPFDHEAISKEWYDSCPKCGQKPKEEGISDGAMGRELGFNHEPYAKKTGVSSCSSFTWAIKPKSLSAKTIKDEYRRKFTREEFDKMLEECPIQFYHLIGVEFS